MKKLIRAIIILPFAIVVSIPTIFLWWLSGDSDDAAGKQYGNSINNMRTIKFRAWDKGENKWLLGYEYPNLGGFSMLGETMMMGEYTNLISSYFPNRIKDIVLMQFKK